MDNDPETTTSCKGQPEEERQNRRQFFSGLGKWSLAIIAAVAALRDGLHEEQSGIGSRFDTPSAGRDDPRQQIAKKRHVDNTTHRDSPGGPGGGYNENWTNHGDRYRQAPGAGTTPSVPGGSLDKTQ